MAAILGVTRTQISDMENGKSGTNLDRLYQLCYHYKVSADYLLGITDDPDLERGVGAAPCGRPRAHHVRPVLAPPPGELSRHKP